MVTYYKEDKIISHFSKYWLKRENKLKFFDRKDYKLLQFIENIKRIEGNKKLEILDVGCGTGNTLENINKYFPGNNLYGIDITASLIDYAKKLRSPNIRFEVGSVLNIPFKECKFDVLLLENVLHHIVGPTRNISKQLMKDAIKECIRVLKKPGYILIDECLVRSRFDSYILFYLTQIYSKINFLNIEISSLEICEEIIVSFLTQAEFIEILESSGFITLYKEVRLWKYKNIIDYIKQKLLRYPNRNIYYMGVIK
ncbi:MAG: class I SAM-dependent methyltransferase [Candidatus Aenigmatarchaeota archaeon]